MVIINNFVDYFELDVCVLGEKLGDSPFLTAVMEEPKCWRLIGYAKSQGGFIVDVLHVTVQSLSLGSRAVSGEMYENEKTTHLSPTPTNPTISLSLHPL